jgi:uncharacterized protein (DUF2252 family)
MDLPRLADRSDRLEQARARKMARSAPAYVCGNTAQFYRWLEGPSATDVPGGPPVWICGDCQKNLDAPSWLWTNVVGLLVAHEETYLEHCRRYALADRLAV